MRRGLTVLLGALALGTVLLAPAAAITVTGDGAIRNTEQAAVQTVLNGETLSTLPAVNAPGAVSIRELVVGLPDAGAGAPGYEAQVTLGGAYESLGEDHITFVSLQDPAGPRERLALHADGSATLDRADGNQFVTVGEADIAIAGPTLTFRLPDGVTADWGIQAHSIWASGGFHSHTYESPVGAFTGERVSNPFTGTGYPREDGRPVFFRLPQAMPEGSLPASLRAVLSPTGGVVVEVAKPAAPDGVTIKLFPGGFGLTDNPLLAWPGPGVEDAGDVLRFDLSADPDIGGAASFPSDFGPTAAVFSATPTSCGGGNVTFTVQVRIADGQFQISHGDGDVASGPFDPTSGTATLTSPGGREYELLELEGNRLEATHVFQGCEYDVVGDLRDAIERTDTGGGGEVITPQIDLTADDFVRVDVDAGGLTAFGPDQRIQALVDGDGAGAGGGAVPDGTTEDDEQPQEQGSAPVEDDGGNGFPIVPVLAAGIAVGVGVLGALVLRRRDDGFVDCTALLDKIAQVDQFLGEQYARLASLTGNLDAPSREVEMAAVHRFIDRNLSFRAQLAAEAEAAGCPVPPLPTAHVDEFGFPIDDHAAQDQAPVLTPTSTREKPGTGGRSDPVMIPPDWVPPPDFSDETYRRINRAMADLSMYVERPGTIVVDATNEDPPFVSVDEVAGWDKLDKIGHVIGTSVSSGDAGDEFVKAVEELVPMIPIAVAVLVGAHVFVIPGLVVDAVAFGMIFYALGSDFLDFVDAMNDAVTAQNKRELEKARQHMAKVLGRIGLDGILALVTALSTIGRLGKAAETTAGKVPKPKRPLKAGTYDALPGEPPTPTGKLADVPSGMTAEDKAFAAIAAAEEAHNAARAEVPIRGAIREWAKIKGGGPKKVPKADAGKQLYEQYLDGLEKARAGVEAKGAAYWAEMDAEARTFLQGHLDSPLGPEAFGVK